MVVSFPSRPQRIISVAVSKGELAQRLLELCRAHSSCTTADLKKLCRDHKRMLAKSAPSEHSNHKSECDEDPGKKTKTNAMKSDTSKVFKHKSKSVDEFCKTVKTDAKEPATSKVSRRKSKCAEQGLSKKTKENTMNSARSTDSRQVSKLGEELSKTTKTDAARSATCTDPKKNSACAEQLSKTTEVDATESAPSIGSVKDAKCGTEFSETTEEDATKSVPSRDPLKNTENDEERNKATELYAVSLREKRLEVDDSSLLADRKRAKKTTQANLERWFRRSICRLSESSQCPGSSSATDLSLTQMLGEVIDMQKPRAHDEPVPDQAGECAEIPLTQMLTEIMMDMSQPLPDMSLPFDNADQSTESSSADSNIKGTISTEKVASFGKPRRPRRKDTRKSGRLSLKGQRSFRSKKATQTTLVF